MNQVKEQILKVEGVSLITKITKQVILDDISLTILAGDCVAIMGSSGAGKTSLLKILNCLQSPTSGNLFFNNINYRHIPVIQLRQNIVYVPQEPKLLEMKVKDALIYPLLLQQLPNIEIKERLDYWREQFKISQDLLERTENQLSLGQRQIITLARALMMKPKLLLLDEPNSALDQGKTDNLLSILHSLSQGEKVPILLISHQFNFVQDFAQKVIYLQQGKILENNLISQVNWPSIQERLKLNNETEFDF
jgi:D-methionine transport system ATP-binding protein